MLGIVIFFAFDFIGMLIRYFTHIPVPANVIGLVLFTAALFMRIIRLSWVEASAEFVLKHLMLFFAPVIVGTMVYFHYIGQHWASIAVSLVLSTFVVLTVTGLVMKMLTGEERGGHESS